MNEETVSEVKVESKKKSPKPRVLKVGDTFRYKHLEYRVEQHLYDNKYLVTNAARKIYPCDAFVAEYQG